MTIEHINMLSKLPVNNVELPHNLIHHNRWGHEEDMKMEAIGNLQSSPLVTITRTYDLERKLSCEDIERLAPLKRIALHLEDIDGYMTEVELNELLESLSKMEHLKKLIIDKHNIRYRTMEILRKYFPIVSFTEVSEEEQTWF